MSFKKPLIAVMFSLSLAGCQLTPPADNKFLFVQPQPSPHLEGIWTGTMGPYMMSLMFDANGTGYDCYAWNGKNVISRIKYDGKNIHYQEGGYQRLDSITSTSLIVSFPNLPPPSYTLVKDNELKQADPFCVVELPKLK